MHEPLKNRVFIALMLTFICGASHGDEGFRDPTRPYKAEIAGVTTMPRYVVNAIIVSSDRRVAIVNGRRVGVGGSIDAATVIAIEKDKLILEVDGKRIAARLHNGAVRQ